MASPAAVAVPQHMAALARANEIRLKRAELKRQLTAGTIGLADVLADEHAATMRVRDVLLALNRYGPTRAARVLGRIGLGHGVLCGGLTPRRRAELVAAVAGADELTDAPALAAPLTLYPAPAVAPEHEASIEALLA